MALFFAIGLLASGLASTSVGATQPAAAASSFGWYAEVVSFDAATGDLKWEYKRKLPDDLGKYFPVPAINRNLAIYGNLIIDTSADDFVYALDANTGNLAWETKILEYAKGAQQTSGPIIVNGKIISGRGCEPEGGPEACIITAHDAKTGKELWVVKLNASVMATPSTYQGKDGRQYVSVVATGGTLGGAPLTSDEVIAFRIKK